MHAVTLLDCIHLYTDIFEMNLVYYCVNHQYVVVATLRLDE